MLTSASYKRYILWKTSKPLQPVCKTAFLYCSEQSWGSIYNRQNSGMPKLTETTGFQNVCTVLPIKTKFQNSRGWWKCVYWTKTCNTHSLFSFIPAAASHTLTFAYSREKPIDAGKKLYGFQTSYFILGVDQELTALQALEKGSPVCSPSGYYLECLANVAEADAKSERNSQEKRNRIKVERNREDWVGDVCHEWIKTKVAAFMSPVTHKSVWTREIWDGIIVVEVKTLCQNRLLFFSMWIQGGI